MPEYDYYPPLDYQWYWWLLLGLALVGIWLLWSLIRNLARKQPKPIPVYMPQLQNRVVTNQLTIRQYALKAIDKVVAEHKAGRITLRDAYQDFAGILREFAWRSSGVDYRSLTLYELKSSAPELLTDAIEDLYPSAFSERSAKNIHSGADIARTVVRQWK